MSGLRRRALRAALSALAGGGLTALGLGGALPGGALGAGASAVPPSSTDGSAAQPSSSSSSSSEVGAEAQQTGAGEVSTSTSTTPSSSSTSTTSSPSSVAAGPASSVPRAGPVEPGGASNVPTNVPIVRLQRRQKTTAASSRGRKLTHTGPKDARRRIRGARGSRRTTATRHNAAPAPQLAAEDQLQALVTLTFSGASAQSLAFYRIPLFLLPIYTAAAARYGVPWQILAAINEVETDYGADLSVSTAGAVGWMQFMPETWMLYGVDALNAGYADPYNPVDAIFAAARYLRDMGAAKNLRAAILAYNHSAAYVESVMLRAELISTYPEPVIATLTSLADGRLPLTGAHVAWEALHPRTSSPSTATADAKALAPATAAAAATGLDAGQLADVRGARNATVVAVREGRIVGLGSSRKLGSYVVLRDLHGDLFTYSGLGSIARSYIVATKASDSSRADRRSTGARDVRLPLRRGSLVEQGTVLGRVRDPLGAKDGHLLFAIRPAGDQRDIDPRPILANWVQLAAALHPRGARVQADLHEATASDVFVLSKSQLERDLNRIPIGLHPTGVAVPLTATGAATGARSASSSRSSRSPLPVNGDLSIAQWDRLIARIAALRAPIVAVRPSSSAIRDPRAAASSRGLWQSPLSAGELSRYPAAAPPLGPGTR
jgi:hypothetical protein